MSKINSAAGVLFDKLSKINISSIKISDYNKRYIKNYLKNLRGTLQKYSHILYLALFENKSVSQEDFVLIDYGAGIGILSLLAKEYGIEMIIYNDIYDISCKDAKQIASLLGNEANYYIQGDFDSLIKFLKNKKLKITAIVSQDVIEHIYNINEFFRKLAHLSDHNCKIVMNTSANVFNPLKIKKIMKEQYELEYKGRKKYWGHKEIDCLEPYYEIRKKIIHKYNPTFSELEIDLLSKSTRELNITDIYKCIEEYMKFGIITRSPKHPTNTCDPYTGNWVEHLMDIPVLMEILKSSGFIVDLLPGYYMSYNNFLKKFIAHILNYFISTFRNYSLKIAPTFTIYAKK